VVPDQPGNDDATGVHQLSADSEQRSPASPSSEKPDAGVTRTPETRAEISVAPQPRLPTENNSANPRDGRKAFVVEVGADEGPAVTSIRS
jgi:hypothetical protein